jgi:hypothetical protein
MQSSCASSFSCAHKAPPPPPPSKLALIHIVFSRNAFSRNDF